MSSPRPQQNAHAIAWREASKLRGASSVATLLARRGLDNEQLADETGLTVRQVKEIVAVLKRAARVRNRTQLALKLAGVLERSTRP